jgi:hypothetical protein
MWQWICQFLKGEAFLDQMSYCLNGQEQVFGVNWSGCGEVTEVCLELIGQVVVK